MNLAVPLAASLQGHHRFTLSLTPLTAHGLSDTVLVPQKILGDLPILGLASIAQVVDDGAN
jgi:hypothetical protein